MPDITLEINEAVPVALDITNQAAINLNYGYGAFGIPAGGDIGDVLTKTGSSDYVATWEAPGAVNDLESYPAGENLSAGRLVVIDAGLAVYFQISNPLHAGRAYGITASSATTGNAVSIRIRGEATDASFSALTDAVLWAGANGQITTTLPVSGTVQKVGIGVGSNAVLIDFSTQITTI